MARRYIQTVKNMLTKVKMCHLLNYRNMPVDGNISQAQLLRSIEYINENDIWNPGVILNKYELIRRLEKDSVIFCNR